MGTGSCSAGAARNPGLRWARILPCLVTVSHAQSLHTGIKMQSWGCKTAAAGWTGEEQTLLPGGCARRSEVEECTKIKLHLAGERVCNSEMQLITESNFTNGHVKLHASELLCAEQPEVEAKLPRLDLRSGFQCPERC